MIPETVDSSQGFYFVGTIFLVLGILAGVAGALIKRRAEEAHREERYVRRRRGEEVTEVEQPRIATTLQYVGVALGAVGIVLLLAGWTIAPGQT